MDSGCACVNTSVLTYSEQETDMTTDYLPPSLLPLLRDLADPDKWKRVKMWPGPTVAIVWMGGDVKRQAGDILREMEEKSDNPRRISVG